MIQTHTNIAVPAVLILALGLLLSGCQNNPDTGNASSMSSINNAGTGTAASHHESRLLAPCPSAPHCVSSLASDKSHYVAPLAGAGNRADSLAMLKAILDQLPRVDYQAVGPARINAQFTSLILRFTDDVTFYVHEDGLIDVRSSSRIGYYDFGVNRGHVEDLRQRLQKRLNPHAAGAEAS